MFAVPPQRERDPAEAGRGIVHLEIDTGLRRRVEQLQPGLGVAYQPVARSE